MKLAIKRLSEGAVLPCRATSGSAGYDLCACMKESVRVEPGEIVRIPTGIAAELDTADAALFIYARSGLASKFGITLANCVGVVDSDYRGEIIVPVINLGQAAYTVEPGQRIAQMVAAPVLLPELEEADSLPETVRGSGGFGSTGL